MTNRTGREAVVKAKFPVTIKGIGESLVFLFNDQCSFDEIVSDLKNKMSGDHGQLFSGPLMQVNVQTGNLMLTPEQEDTLRHIFSAHSNLVVQGFKGANGQSSIKKSSPLIHYGTIRSGQKVEHQGDLVVVGDINPGGEVIASGDIIVMGALRGLAHAGNQGDDRAIIAAVYFQPTQLRIDKVISRSPDTSWPTESNATEMEFAYIRDGQMAVDRMSQLHLLRLRQ